MSDGSETGRSSECSCGCNHSKSVDLELEIEEYEANPQQQIALEMSKQRKVREIEKRFIASAVNRSYVFPRKQPPPPPPQSQPQASEDEEDADIASLSNCTFYNLNVQQKRFFQTRILRRSQIPSTATTKGQTKDNHSLDQQQQPPPPSQKEEETWLQQHKLRSSMQANVEDQILSKEGTNQYQQEKGKSYYNIPIMTFSSQLPQQPQQQQQQQQKQQVKHRKFFISMKSEGSDNQNGTRTEDIHVHSAEKEKSAGVPPSLKVRNQRSMTGYSCETSERCQPTQAGEESKTTMFSSSSSSTQQQQQRKLRPTLNSEVIDQLLFMHTSNRGGAGVGKQQNNNNNNDHQRQQPSSTKAEATAKLITNYSFFPAATTKAVPSSSKDSQHHNLQGGGGGSNAFVSAKYAKGENARGFSVHSTFAVGGGDTQPESTSSAPSANMNVNSFAVVGGNQTMKLMLPVKRRAKLSKKSLLGEQLLTSAIPEELEEGNLTPLIQQLLMPSPLSRSAKKRVVIGTSSQQATKSLRGGNFDVSLSQVKPPPVTVKDFFDVSDSSRPIKTDGNYDDHRSDVSFVYSRKIPPAGSTLRKNKSISTHSAFKLQESQVQQQANKLSMPVATLPANISGYSTISRGNSKSRHQRQILSSSNVQASQLAANKSKSDESKVFLKLSSQEIDHGVPAAAAVTYGGGGGGGSQPSSKSGRSQLLHDSMRTLGDTKKRLQMINIDQHFSDEQPQLLQQQLPSLQSGKSTVKTSNYMNTSGTPKSIGTKPSNVKPVGVKKSMHADEREGGEVEETCRQRKRNSEYLNSLLVPHANRLTGREASVAISGIATFNPQTHEQISEDRQGANAVKASSQSRGSKNPKLRIVLPSQEKEQFQYSRSEPMQQQSSNPLINTPSRNFTLGSHQPFTTATALANTSSNSIQPQQRLQKQLTRPKKQLVIHSGVTLSLNSSSSTHHQHQLQQQQQQPSQIHLNMYSYH